MNEYGLKASLINECRKIAINHFKELGVTPLYITISGSHLYGFPSKDSDIDVRCCHVRDTKSLFRLHSGSDVYTWKTDIDGIIVELESQEVKKVMGLALDNNSNILENMFAKNLIPSESLECQELKKVTHDGISKIVAKPYHGMAEYNYKKFIESMNPSYNDKLVKKYLYVARSWLVGANVLKTGKIVPNIRHHIDELDDESKTIIKDLIAKKSESEYQLTTLDHKRCREMIARLKAKFIIAENESKLMEKPDTFERMDDLLYNMRLRHI